MDIEKMLQNVEILNNEVEDEEYHQEPRLVDLVDELTYGFGHVIKENTIDYEDYERTTEYVIKLVDKYYSFEITEDETDECNHFAVGFIWYSEVKPKEVTKIEYIKVQK